MLTRAQHLSGAPEHLFYLPRLRQAARRKAPRMTSSSTVTVRFDGLSETPATMRIAESEAALLGAAWVPYAASSPFDLAATSGAPSVYAQVADAAGNASTEMLATIVLDLALPTSTAGPPPAVASGTGISVPFTASDDAGISHVELWFRYRPRQSATWSAWARLPPRRSGPPSSEADPRATLDPSGKRDQWREIDHAPTTGRVFAHRPAMRRAGSGPEGQPLQDSAT